MSAFESGTLDRALLLLAAFADAAEITARLVDAANISDTSATAANLSSAEIAVSVAVTINVLDSVCRDTAATSAGAIGAVLR